MHTLTCIYVTVGGGPAWHPAAARPGCPPSGAGSRLHAASNQPSSGVTEPVSVSVVASVSGFSHCLRLFGLRRLLSDCPCMCPLRCGSFSSGCVSPCLSVCTAVFFYRLRPRSAVSVPARVDVDVQQTSAWFWTERATRPQEALAALCLHPFPHAIFTAGLCSAWAWRGRCVGLTTHPQYNLPGSCLPIDCPRNITSNPWNFLVPTSHQAWPGWSPQIKSWSPTVSASMRHHVPRPLGHAWQRCS